MRKQLFQKGHYYHIYNRGVMKEPIFYSRANRLFFLQRLHKYFTHDLAMIVAYCLMPNHYHLLVQVFTEQFGHKVMQPLGVSYTKAINKEQGRVGPLFQGPFQAKPVTSDGHLIHLSRYIHLNPVKAGLIDDPANWEFSSFQDYVGLRKGTLPNSQVILEQFRSIEEYGTYVRGETADNSDLVPSQYEFE